MKSKNIAPIVSVIFDIVVQKLESDYVADVDRQHELLVQQGADKFTDVRLTSNKLQQGLHLFIHGTFWVGITFLILWVILSATNSVPSSFLPFTWLFMLTLPPLLFLIGYTEEAVLYKKYSGFGNDAVLERRFGRSLFLADGGIFTSVLHIPWFTISKIIDTNETTITIIPIAPVSFFSKLHTKPPLIMIFATPADKLRFTEQLKNKISLRVP